MLNANTLSASFPVPMPRDIRVLLLDDSKFDRARIRRMSDKTNLSIQMDEVDSIATMNAAVARENYDLIMIDYRLPVGNGLDALDHVLQNDLNREAGKIMITGDGARETAVQAMRHGCHDFLTKEEMNADALRSAMLNALQTAQQRQMLLQQTEHQKEIIRLGLVAAMQDRDVQSNIISLIRQHLGAGGALNRGANGRLDDADMDALIASFGDTDDFIFH
ncbi:MAG: response regulator [Sulfitobacter sp.]|jgi:DNA-binding NtrC family response regulator|nr:response regulator [Sulfitobacter sp.]